ncbi:MAG: hypothetical protein M1831_005245 [Alyxoria varia]|nr:MAG: hypothetical protein M1831_005245 [Alyxoria varia]
MPAADSFEPASDRPILSNKRKRSDQVDDQDANGSIGPVKHSSGNAFLIQRRLRDVFQVLNRYDTTPSILEYALCDPLTSDTCEEPGTKRTKLADDTNHENHGTIAKKVQNLKYTSFEDFRSDVGRAITGILSSAKSHYFGEDADSQWRYSPRNVEYPRLVAHSQAFRKMSDDLMRSEQADAASPLTNGAHESLNDKEALDICKDDASKRSLGGKAVLTLFGNAQGHKQLFSSAQKPLPRKSWTSRVSGSEAQTYEDAIMPLRENGLPNQIFRTGTMPVDGSANNIRPARFIDSFAPPQSLRSMSPPKVPKYPSTRGSSVTWTHDVPVQDPPRKLEYTEQKLPAGQWLGYNGLAVSQEPSSPEEKRKRRDRALSTGEASIIPSEGAKAAQHRAKEEALFRSAYSSFAPSIDNSSALVPEEVRSRIWWETYGQSSFERNFPLDAEFEGEDLMPGEDVPGRDPDEETCFREAVEQFDPSTAESVDPIFDTETGSGSTTDVLHEVGELLEMLYSHQRIRNSSVSSKNRPSATTSTSSQEINSGLSVPTKDEQETYKKIKSRLASLVGTLPPYDLTKLKGQHSGLTVSQRLVVEGESYRGSMEEDQLSRMAKNAAFNAARGATSGARPMATPASRNSQNAQTTRPTPLQQYTNASQNVGRGPGFQRQPLNGWQNTPQTYSTSAQRSNNYSQTPTYPRSQADVSQGNPRQVGTGVPMNYSQTPNQQAYHQRAQRWNNSAQPRNGSPPQAYQQLTHPNNRSAGYQGPNGLTPQPAPTTQARPNYSALAAQQMRSNLVPTSPLQPATANMKPTQGSPSPLTPSTPAQPIMQRRPSQAAAANVVAAPQGGTPSGQANQSR